MPSAQKAAANFPAAFARRAREIVAEQKKLHAAALDAGLRAYERVAKLAAPLVKEGGYLGLCSCSHAADLQKFRAASARGIGRAGRRGLDVEPSESPAAFATSPSAATSDGV